MIDVTQSGPSPRGCTRKRLAGAVRSAFAAARRNPRGAVALRFVTEKEIASLNKRYCGKDRPTDVLSFASPDAWAGRSEAKEWGDIVVAPSVASRDAKKMGIRPSDEVVRLVAHGTLHLLGYDHATPKDEKRMIRIQERAVRRALRV